MNCTWNETFRVRRIFQGIGIERTFLVHSPKIRAVKIIRSGRTRRAKLYFLRYRIGTKATRLRNLQIQTTQEKSNSAD